MKWIHFQALVVLVVYEILTKGSLGLGVSGWNSWLGVLTTGVFGGIFLYLFSHEDFFKFAKEIEKKEKSKEKAWEKRFKGHRAWVTVFLTAIVTGPLIASLVARFLLKNKDSRYLLVILGSSISAALWILFLSRGWNLFTN